MTPSHLFDSGLKEQDAPWKGKRILITGGSAGLGRELALAAAAQGARVAVVARDGDRLAALASEPSHSEIHRIQADVADKDAVYRIAGEAAGILGGLDLLVNNASYLGATPLRLLADSDCEDLELALATNVLAPFRLTKALLPSLLLHGGGLVVNISSDAAVSAYPAWGAYGTAKAGLDHLSRIFDAELSGQGVRVLAIDPGDMRTAMHFAAIPDADPATLYAPAEVARDLLAFLPLAAKLGETRYQAGAWRQLLQTKQ